MQYEMERLLIKIIMMIMTATMMMKMTDNNSINDDGDLSVVKGFFFTWNFSQKNKTNN